MNIELQCTSFIRLHKTEQFRYLILNSYDNKVYNASTNIYSNVTARYLRNKQEPEHAVLLRYSTQLLSRTHRETNGSFNQGPIRSNI